MRCHVSEPPGTQPLSRGPFTHRVLHQGSLKAQNSESPGISSLY